MRGLKEHFERKFVAGVLAAIPLAVTAFILWYVDSKVRELFPVRYPFLGIAVALVVIYLLGLFVTSLTGRYFLRVLDWVLTHVPGLRDLYRTWKQIAVTPGMDPGVFARVVTVPDESGRMRMLGFTSGKPIEGTSDTLCVFVPASPNPTSGRLYFVRLTECVFLPLGAQEALKFIISGGNYVPGAVGPALVAR
jgi:uncharacterized membrane protein